MTAIGDQKERWLPCPDYEDRYEVSDQGRIRSLPRKGVKGGILKNCPSSDGYLQVSLRKNGKLRVVMVHRLICRAFHGEQPNPLHKQVAHLDGVRTNATATNLKWVGVRQNHLQKMEHGTWQARENHPRAKLTEADVLRIRTGGETAAQLAEALSISPYTVSDIRRGRRWKHAARCEARERRCEAIAQPPSGANQ